MIETNHIDKQIRAYKAKYFKKRLLKGTALFLALLLITFFTFSLIEHVFHFNKVVRAILFFSFIGSFLYLLYTLIIRHLLEIINLDRNLSDEVAARNIGTTFPDIGDRLLNLVQLKNYNANSLAAASIDQRSGFLKSYNFTQAINLSDTLKYWRIAGLVILFLVGIYFIQPEIFKSSPERIVNYNQEFVPQAPFNFEVNIPPIAYKNEDLSIEVKVTGDAIPDQVYIEQSSRRIKLQKIDNQTFTYTAQKIQQDLSFTLEAAGFNSKRYEVKVVNRPNLGDFNVLFNFPSYIKRENVRLENTGHFQIPEGTTVEWQVQPKNANKITLLFQNDHDTLSKEVEGNIVKFEKVLSKSTDYEITLENKYSLNKEPIIYHAEVIPDLFPSINVNFYQDTILYRFVMISGNLNDDYGLSRLKLFYRVKGEKEDPEFSALNIPISSKENSQSFNYEWLLDSISLSQGETLEYFLQVWDNDGFNGNKSSKTGLYTLRVPDNNDLKEELAKTAEQTEQNIDKSLKETQELNRQLEETTQKLKGKKNLTWQDEKKLKELLDKREELNKALEDLKKQHANQEMKRERFNEQNDKIKEKVEQLQQLMDELLDEETKKLYEELEKLLEEKRNSDDIQQLLNKMQHKEKNLEKELERTLELFKRMKFEHKLEENIAELEQIENEQRELVEQESKKVPEESENPIKDPKTEDEPDNNETDSSENEENSESQAESPINEQEKLKEKFEELKESIKQMEQLNQNMQQPELLPEDLKEQQENISQEMKNAQEQLQKNNKKKANDAQKNAADQMKEMKESLAQMQGSMEMEMMMENLDDLRHIVHNLLKISFDQEKLMKEFQDVQQSDPRFVTLAQEQLKIMDDSKIVEDSLYSLANRVFQIKSFVTRELAEMNSHLEKTTEAIRERKKPVAVSEQQFAMTSMNNLALLLDDVLQQMQNAMAEALGNPKPGDKKSKGPTLGEMQQQLNEQIGELKKSGKTGRALSEELAKLAAQQERIRKALQEMQEKFGEDGGQQPGQGLPKKMEETEKDLVNKQLTEQTIKRQQEILVRLLEAEKSMRERELDDERKGETANPVKRDVPPAFEEYFKQKEQEIELLKTIPPKLFPYYRKEVNEYFKRLGEQLE